MDHSSVGHPGGGQVWGRGCSIGLRLWRLGGRGGQRQVIISSETEVDPNDKLRGFSPFEQSWP